MMAGMIFCTLVLLLLSIIVRRVYFHPLSKFPGHWCAAASSLFEFYHNVIRRGQYVEIVDEMHKRYGNVACYTPSAC